MKKKEREYTQEFKGQISKIECLFVLLKRFSLETFSEGQNFTIHGFHG